MHEHHAHHAVVYWYVRNAGCRGFGPFADLEPRRVMEIREGRWQLVAGHHEGDIGAMPPGFVEDAMRRMKCRTRA